MGSAKLSCQPHPLHNNPLADSLGAMYMMESANLPILAGTDVDTDGFRVLTPGFSLHAELAIYVAEGLSPLTALQTATLNPAKFLHATDSLGTVAAGKLADLVLLDADPLLDIAHVGRVRAVVLAGRLLAHDAIDHMLATARAAPEIVRNDWK